MAKQQAGEPKTPLIVAMVFFVLTTLALGVLYYMSTEKITALTAEAKKASDDKSTSEKKLSAEQEKVQFYRVLAGVSDQNDLESLKSARNADVVQQEYAKVMGEIRNKLQGAVTREAKNFVGSNTRFAVAPNDVVQWAWPQGKLPDAAPKRSMLDAVVSSYAGQQLAAVQLNTEHNELEKSKAAYAAMAGRAATAEKLFKDVAAKYPDMVNAATAKANAAADATRATFKTKTDEYTKDIQDRTEKNQAQAIQLQDAKERSTNLQNQVNRLEDAENEKQDPFAYDTPHGKVVGRNGNLVTINLGSADNVRSGLTFSIYPSNTPERGFQDRTRPRRNDRGRPIADKNGNPLLEIIPKGTIEVVDVLGPGVSQARITSNPDPIREPILKGDLLYNPAWRKGGADHVALFGLFDVDGDGVDDIKRVVRDLSKMGIVVDAYFDLDQKKWVGKVTEQTAFAVEGYYPVSEGADALAAAKTDLYQAIVGARTLAKDKGVKVVRARDFFTRIGYKMKLDTSADAVNRAFNRYLHLRPVAGPAGENPGQGQ
jgi:hypothetical protein